MMRHRNNHNAIVLFDESKRMYLMPKKIVGEGSFGKVVEYGYDRKYDPFERENLVVKIIENVFIFKFRLLEEWELFFEFDYVENDIDMVNALLQCSEDLGIVHASNVSTVGVTYKGRLAFAHRLNYEGANSNRWLISRDDYNALFADELFNSRRTPLLLMEPPRPSLELGITSFQIMEKTLGDVTTELARAEYDSRTTTEGMQRHLMLMRDTLCAAAYCANAALTDVKATNILIANINNELRPVFGDLGSFTAFGSEGISTYSMPFESSRMNVRPSNYPAALGFFVMYVIYDALFERLYTRDRYDVTLMETLMFSDEVNAGRWPSQRFSVNYQRAHDIDARRQGTAQERYCQGLNLCTDVIIARLTKSRAEQIKDAVVNWWNRIY